MIKVLIVEDDPMVAKLNKRYVESVKNFNVVSIVKNGEEALKFVKSKKVDLIILDIYMPKLDGISFLKEMRKENIMIDAILITAAQETQNIDEALKLGGVDYLIKPFEYERLKKSLDDYFCRYELLHNKSKIRQKDIDKITKKISSGIDITLQKGLHKKTLERIRYFIQNNKDNLVTSEDVAQKIGASRVTARRYLEYLVHIEEIRLEVEYGSTGRPKHLYKYNR